jgi:hypothetical protein
MTENPEARVDINTLDSPVFKFDNFQVSNSNRELISYNSNTMLLKLMDKVVIDLNTGNVVEMPADVDAASQLFWQAVSLAFPDMLGKIVEKHLAKSNKPV